MRTLLVSSDARFNVEHNYLLCNKTALCVAKLWRTKYSHVSGAIRIQSPRLYKNPCIPKLPCYPLYYISNDGAHALLITTSHKFYLLEETSRKEKTLTPYSQWWLSPSNRRLFLCSPSKSGNSNVVMLDFEPCFWPHPQTLRRYWSGLTD